MRAVLNILPNFNEPRVKVSKSTDKYRFFLICSELSPLKDFYHLKSWKLIWKKNMAPNLKLFYVLNFKNEEFKNVPLFPISIVIQFINKILMLTWKFLKKLLWYFNSNDECWVLSVFLLKFVFFIFRASRHLFQFMPGNDERRKKEKIGI